MNSIGKILLAAGLVVASGSILYAAPGDDAAADTATDTAATTTTATTDEAPPVVLTVPQLRASVDTLVKQVSDDGTAVQRLQIVARKDKDVIKLNCVNDKLLQVKGEQNLVDETVAGFNTAIADDNADQAQASHAALVAKAESVRQLKEGAMACMGDELSVVGDGTVDVDGPDMPDDPTKEWGDVGLEQPGYVTPWF